MWIKICGVTRPEDAAIVVRSGADAIGLNFFPGSKRFVTPTTARMIVEAARAVQSYAVPVDIVGVFVNTEPETVRDAVRDVELNVLQIHGDETPEQIVSIHRLCPDTPVIRAFRVNPQNIHQTLRDIDRLTDFVPLVGVLLDAFVPGAFGGTGVTVDATILQQYEPQKRPKMILAGGLKPDNVASIAMHPAVWGIDTASGVESSLGIKDSVLVQRFINAARAGKNTSAPLSSGVRIGVSTPMP